MQLDSDVSDTGEQEALMGFTIPIGIGYAVMPELTVGLQTGIYSGPDFKVGASDGGRLPLFVGGLYDVGPVNVGAGVGFASLMTGDDAFYPGIGDALAVGAMVEWSNQ